MTKKLYNLNVEPLIEGGTLDSGEIMINIELLWDKYRNENKFIKDFAAIITHELLHQCCRDIISNEYPYGEEKAIRNMLNQEFTDREKRFYNDKRKARQIKYRVLK